MPARSLSEPFERLEDRQIGLALAVLLQALTATDACATRCFDAFREVVDESGLADSRLARDENDLSFASECLREPIVERARLSLAPDEMRNRVRGIAEITRLARSRGRDPTVADAADRLDVPWRVHPLAESRPHRPDAYLERDRRHVRSLPDVGEELFLRHELARPLREIVKHGERARLERDHAIAAPQSLFGDVEAKRPETQMAPTIHHSAVAVQLPLRSYAGANEIWCWE